MKEPSYVSFEAKKYPYSREIDYSKQPLLYELGRGQQGVLICEPYKSHLYPLWKFRTEEIAKESAEKISVNHTGPSSTQFGDLERRK